VSHNPSENILF